MTLTPPTAPPTKKVLPKNTLLSPNANKKKLGLTFETSPMAQRQYFQSNLQDASSMSVPEIVDRFNEQIELNEMALAQEAEEKIARRERYLESQKKNRKHNKAKKAALEAKKKEQERSSKGRQHYSLEARSNHARQGVLMNHGQTSFTVDPRTYQAPKNLPAPTQPETELLLQALADNVLLKDKPRHSRSSDPSTSGNQKDDDKLITTTTQELRDALVKAFETVLIKKGQTLEEALQQQSVGSRRTSDSDISSLTHHEGNCLYVIESGEIDLKDASTGKRVATATAG